MGEMRGILFRENWGWNGVDVKRRKHDSFAD